LLPPAPALLVGLLPAAPALALDSLPALPALHGFASGQSSPITIGSQPLGAIESGASKSTDQSTAQGRFGV
jgi:hypothetical protein